MGMPAQPAQAAVQVFSGAGSANALPTFNAFASAIGGVNNGVAPPPATGGRREINWDGVAVDGSIAGSQVIVPNTTVGIPTDLFQPRGVVFDRIHAVAIDSFVSVNPGVAGQFPPFTPNRIFGPFNNNTVTVNFVLSSGRGTAQVPAGTRGFGAVFLDVETPNSTSIEYFAGTTSLGKFFVQPGPTSQPEFLGVLFDTPMVTSVRLTYGAGTVFSFTAPGPATPGSPDITVNPATGIDQVSTDDFIYAEPTTPAPFTPVVAGGLPPATSGQNVPCAGTAGQTCTIAGAANGTWTEGTTHPFTITASGPATTVPGSTPTAYLPTLTGVEAFNCTPVGPVAPFTTTCTGSTVGDLKQGATVTVRFATVLGSTQDVTGTVTGPGPTSVTIAQATGLVAASGTSAAGGCAVLVGQNCQAAGGVNGTGSVISSMRWNLTATVPAAAGPGVVPVAVFTTTTSPPNEGFACSPVVVGVPTVTCSGTTVGNALQGSTVTVVFAPGVVVTGTITGPGAAAALAAAIPPPLPPPPPPPLPLLPPPPILPPFGGAGAAGATMPAMARPTATPTPAPDVSRAPPMMTSAQSSSAAPASASAQSSSAAPASASTVPASTSATQPMPVGAPPARPAVADVPPAVPSGTGALIPDPAAVPAAVSPVAPADPMGVPMPAAISPMSPADSLADPASMMPPGPDEPVSSVATPSDTEGDDSLQDIPLVP
ncbi:MAG TPA: hypothetical protein VII06_05605 [Chloroflexota bacterium]